jgi:hypothetical protein
MLQLDGKKAFICIGKGKTVAKTLEKENNNTLEENSLP